MLKRSERWVFFIKDISASVRPGPVKVPLPRFPYVPGAGRTKALGLNHALGVLSKRGPLKAGLTEGRSGFRVSPSPDQFEPIWGVKGKPLSKLAMPFNCQPFASFSPQPPVVASQRLPWPKGSS